MYEKFAVSLSSIYEVHVIGFKAPIPLNSKIKFHPLFSFQRNEQKRWKSGLSFYKKLKELKPDLLIIHAVELLPVVFIYKLFYTCQLIYDVRENYYRNIWYQNNYSSWMKRLLAIAVRSLEYLSQFFVRHYFLAERNYEKEFSFSKGKSTIIENKFQMPRGLNQTKRKPLKGWHFVYSGTISQVYGIWQAIDFAIKLHQINSNVQLTIIGFCSQAKLLKQIRQKINQFEFIELIGGESFVPHLHILEKLLDADFALLSYTPNRSTENCIPTKLFECISLKIPMIVQRNTTWDEMLKKYNAGVSIDFMDFNPSQLLDLLNRAKYHILGDIREVYWVSEEKKMQSIIGQILNK